MGSKLISAQNIRSGSLCHVRCERLTTGFHNTSEAGQRVNSRSSRFLPTHPAQAEELPMGNNFWADAVSALVRSDSHLQQKRTIFVAQCQLIAAFCIYRLRAQLLPAAR